MPDKMSKPLSGIRVIDLSQFLPGPFAAQTLSDMGADVVKVEPPSGDPMRSLNPFTNERGDFPFHAIVNAGKRLVRLDLKSHDGKGAFCQLIAAADVLIESYRPGVMERLGLDFSYLSSLNPRLVHCALSGYGQTGPLRQRSGHDINYLASSGGLQVSGSKELPIVSFPPVADYGGAMQAVIAIQAALLGRAQTGQGSYLDVAMADTMLSWQAFGLTQQMLAGRGEGVRPDRAGGLLNGGAACYQIYETKDQRFVSLGAIEVPFWENFCNAVGHKDWIERQFDALPQNDLIDDVQGLFHERSRDEWDRELGDVDCCYHPVLNYEELAISPQIMDRKVWVSENKQSGETVDLRAPVWVNGLPPTKRESLLECQIEDILDHWG